MLRLPLLVRAFTFVGLTLSAMAASAGPIYTFSISEGTQPSNVGTITLTQVNATTVGVLVDLQSGYGFLNTGGPHTPFAFTLGGSETGVTANFTQPAGGTYPDGTFSLNLAGGDNTPYGTYGVAIDDSAGNGSGKAYFGDLAFLLSRSGGLSTDDFVKNDLGFYFSADLTNGQNTGAQAWADRGGLTVTAVPEPASMMLLGSGLIGVVSAAKRRRKARQIQAE